MLQPDVPLRHSDFPIPITPFLFPSILFHFSLLRIITGRDITRFVQRSKRPLTERIYLVVRLKEEEEEEEVITRRLFLGERPEFFLGKGVSRA